MKLLKEKEKCLLFKSAISTPTIRGMFFVFFLITGKEVLAFPTDPSQNFPKNPPNKYKIPVRSRFGKTHSNNIRSSFSPTPHSGHSLRFIPSKDNHSVYLTQPPSATQSIFPSFSLSAASVHPTAYYFTPISSVTVHLCILFCCNFPWVSVQALTQNA